jgi:hypothetical protein
MPEPVGSQVARQTRRAGPTTAGRERWATPDRSGLLDAQASPDIGVHVLNPVDDLRAELQVIRPKPEAAPLLQGLAADSEVVGAV